MSSQSRNSTSTKRSSTALILILSSSKKNAQLLLLCSLTYFYLANTAPLEVSRTKGLSQEWREAREIWNGVRSVKKQLAQRELSRFRRESDVPTPLPYLTDNYGLDNISVPAYVKELYRNISLLDPEDIDATTIRTLPAIYSGDGDGCGFNFTIGELSQFEILRRAELRIHMQQPRGDRVKPVYLQLYHGSRKGSYKIISPNREGWVVFDVLNDIQQWREHHHKKIHFHIIMYTVKNDFLKRQNGTNCHNAPIKFHQPVCKGENCSDEESTADLEPLLVIYTHDINLINSSSAIVQAAVENLKSTSQHRRQATDPEYSNINEEVALRARQRCRKHTLQISLNTFNTIWHLARPTQTAIFPQQFNINICGGNCNRDVPISPAQHSIMLFYLQTRNHNVPINGTHWSQCCAPVKYEPIEALFSLPEGEVRIVTLKNISVGQCSCLTILDWDR